MGIIEHVSELVTLDKSLWASGWARWARLESLRSHIPSWIKQPEVDEFNSILEVLQTGSGADFSPFRISPAEVKPRVISGSRATRRSAGYLTYSQDGYCESSLFRRRIEAAWNFGRTLDPFPETKIEPISPQVINVGHMYGSAIQQGTSGSSVQIRFRSEDPNLRDVIDDIKRATTEATDFAPETKSLIIADVSSIEAQLSSPAPKTSIITECLHSVRSAFEGAAGNALYAGIIYEIRKLRGS